MHNNKQTLLLLMVILLTGYGLFCPYTADARQRSRHAADSIAHAAMNGGRMLRATGSANRMQAELRLRSSEMGAVVAQRLGDNEAFYVYGNANSTGGFVIVSADDRMPDVLAYSATGSFTTADMPPAVRYWLECYLDDFLSLDSEARIEKQGDGQKDAYGLQNLRPEGVAPILGELLWGQGDPYNRLCPTAMTGLCVTGCVATAMAQVMWSHKWPERGKGYIDYTTYTHRLRVRMNLADHPLRWDMMKEKYQRGNYTDADADAVATLMAACGAAVHMDYAPDGSGAYQYDMLKALVSNFAYDPDAAFLERDRFTSADWNNLLIAELNAGRAVNYAGQSRSDGGHSFVIDGYDGESNNHNPYYHLNWGWSGQCDGYYTLPQLHPQENGQYYVREGFTQSQQMLIGVHPDDGQREANKMMLASGLKVLQATLKPGEATTMQVGEITNLCYRTFNGQIAVKLTNDSLGDVIVGRTQMDPLAFLDDRSNMALQFAIPMDMAEGTYSVRLVSIDSEGLMAEMYCRSTPQVTVSNNPYGEEDEPSGTTLLCSSEMEVFRQAGLDSLVSLRVYEIFNYSEDLLEGDLQLELADDGGTSLMTIGTSAWHPAFEPQAVDTDPIILSGGVPDTLANGHYRLYVLFFPTRLPANRVRLYDRAEPETLPADYYLPVTISDDTVIVDGVAFTKAKTGIASVAVRRTARTAVYSVSGQRLAVPRRGLNIIRGKDGHVRKAIMTR